MIFYFTNRCLKLVQYKVSGSSTEKIKEKTLPYGEDTFNPQAIRTLFQKEGFFKSRVVGCLFRHQVVARFFVFPSQDPDEVARMVRYEASDLLPLKAENMITRYLILNQRGGGYSDTLVIVSHKEEINKIVKFFNAAGLRIDAINLSTMGLLECMREVFFKRRQAGIKSNIMLVHFENEIVEIIAARDGHLSLSRGFVVDRSRNITQVLLSEIRHSMELFFDQTKTKHMDRIVLSGHREDLPDLARMLEEHFEIPLSVEDRIDITKGLANKNVERVNLLSDEFMLNKLDQKLKKNFLIFSALFLINVFLLSAVFFVGLNNKRRYLKRLKVRLIRLKPEAEAVQQKLEKLKVFQNQLSARVLILDAITDLVKNVSPSCTLSMFSINEQGVLVVRGESKGLQDVLDFVLELDKSPYFKNAHLNYSSRRKLQDRQVLDFEIQADLNRKQ